MTGDGSQISSHRRILTGKVEKDLKDSLDSIASPSPSVRIQIMVGKVCLMHRGGIYHFSVWWIKVDFLLKGSQDLIPSP